MKREFLLMSGLAALSLSGALLGCGAGGDPTDDPTPTPTPGAQTRKIVFTSDRADTTGHSNLHIFSMNADGSNQTQLTTGPRVEISPRLSPDGTRIAFIGYTAAQGTFTQIFVMNIDGTGQTALTSTETFKNTPSWSPDGQTIAFESTGRDGAARSARIHTVGATPGGAGEKELIFDPLYGYLFPEYAPDGRIVFVRFFFNSSRFGLFVAAADGTGATQIVADSQSSLHTPRWSPDGSTILYGDLDRGLRLVKPDGTGNTAVGNASEVIQGAWSPDSKKILREALVGGKRDIMLQNIDGSGLDNLTRHPEDDTDASW